MNIKLDKAMLNRMKKSINLREICRETDANYPHLLRWSQGKVKTLKREELEKVEKRLSQLMKPIDYSDPNVCL